MSLNRWNAKRDANEKAIVDALERVGAIVFQLSGKGVPDLLVLFRGVWTPLEVKSKVGTLTPQQENRFVVARMPIARTPEAALKTIGAL